MSTSFDQQSTSTTEQSLQTTTTHSEKAPMGDTDQLIDQVASVYAEIMAILFERPLACRSLLLHVL